MPKPETPEEEALVQAAQIRWDEEFWMREDPMSVPDYVKALWPEEIYLLWPNE